MGSSTSATSSPDSTATHPQRVNIDRHITAAHVNINSITTRCLLDELSLFDSVNDLDILCLSETKLDNSVHPSLFFWDNFHDQSVNLLHRFNMLETSSEMGQKYEKVLNTNGVPAQFLDNHASYRFLVNTSV